MRRWRCFYTFGRDMNYVSRGLDEWVEESNTDPSREDVLCELIGPAPEPEPIQIDIPKVTPAPKQIPMANTGGKEEEKGSGAKGWEKQVSASQPPGAAAGAGGPGTGAVGPALPDVRLRDGTGTEVNILPGAWSGVVNVDVTPESKAALAKYAEASKANGEPESLAGFLKRSWRWILLALFAGYAAKKGGLF